jgi:phenylacetate-CoA oxygenase PaaI subunit
MSGPDPSLKITFDEAADEEAQELAARSTTSVVEKVETVGAMEPRLRGTLFALLSSLADNKYLLGRRYVEWCTGAPMLESAIASAAMAQDEIGHARSFYPLLRGFPEASAMANFEEAGWQNRPTSAMHCLNQPFATWTQFVAANFVVDTALTTLLETATACWYEPLGQRARKIVQEEEAHFTHGQGWVRRLSADEKQRPGLIDGLGMVWDDAFSWFGQNDDPVLSLLHAEGMLSSDPNAMRARLLARLEPQLQASGLTADLVSRPIPWDRWDPTARQLKGAS